MPPLAPAVPRWQAVLEAAGFPPARARRDAILLARHHLGWDAAAWLTRSREPAPERVIAEIDALVARRAQHEPIAYIVGNREFYGRTFIVTRDVLIPRPETEWLVEQALAVLHGSADRVTHVVDVGTGSGCVAITLALEQRDARVFATDISSAALDVARANAVALAAERRVTFLHAPLIDDVPRPIDVIVSNPPYIAGADRASLPREVAEFEPPAALFAGDDGLDVIRALAAAATQALAPDGWLLMEIGQGQERLVREILEHHALSVDRVAADLQGIPRVVVARRTSS